MKVAAVVCYQTIMRDSSHWSYSRSDKWTLWFGDISL